MAISDWATTRRTSLDIDLQNGRFLLVFGLGGLAKCCAIFHRLVMKEPLILSMPEICKKSVKYPTRTPLDCANQGGFAFIFRFDSVKADNFDRDQRDCSFFGVLIGIREYFGRINLLQRCPYRAFMSEFEMHLWIKSSMEVYFVIS